MPTEQSDGTESLNGLIDNDGNPSFLDREASFVAPTSKAPASKSSTSSLASFQGSHHTPRAVLTNITNQNRVGGCEFTPVLQSAFRGNKKPIMPATMLQGPRVSQASPGLPADTEEGGDYSVSMEDVTRTSIQHFDRLGSESSTPVPGRGVAGSENMLTLREQEKAIDEINKENFSLKLRIYFLTQQLKKSAPEEYSGTLQQNVEMKAEQVKMRSELAQLRKQLNESQAKVTQLTSSIAANLSEHEGLNEEDKLRLSQFVDDKQKASEELFDARAEIEKLQEELQEYRTLLDEAESGQSTSEDLKTRIAELESELENLNELNSSLTSKLEEAEDNLADLSEKLREADHQIEQLQDTIESLQSNDDSANVVSTVSADINGSQSIITTMQEHIDRLTSELQQANSQALSEKENCEKAERTLQDLESRNAQLEETVRRLQSDATSTKENRASKSETMDEDSYMARLMEFQADMDILHKELVEKDNIISALRTKFSDLEKTKANINDWKSQQIEKYQHQIDNEVQLKEEAQKNADVFKEQAMALENQIGELEKSLRKKEASITDLRSRLTDAEAYRVREAQNERESPKEPAVNYERLHAKCEKLRRERDEALATLRNMKVEIKRRESQADLHHLEKISGDAKMLKSQLTRMEKRHDAEINGLVMQIRYLRAKSERDHGLRLDFAFMKQFFLLQISGFESCNQANLYILEQIGIYPEKKHREKRPTLRSVAHAVIAAIRLRNMKDKWSSEQKIHSSLVRSLQVLKDGRRRH